MAWSAMKLTLARINAAEIPPGKAELKLWDAAVSGLYLRLLAGGGRSWVFRYRADGGGRSAKIRSIKLGNYPALTLDAARAAARAHAGQVARGQDPARFARRSDGANRQHWVSCWPLTGPMSAASRNAISCGPGQRSPACGVASPN